MPVPISASDLRVIEASLHAVLQHPDPQIREADFQHPLNPRRVQLVLEKLRPHLESLKPEPEDHE